MPKKRTLRTIRPGYINIGISLLANYIAQAHTQRITNDTHRFDRKVRTSRFDTAQIGSFHVATVCKFLYRQTSLLPQLSDPGGDIGYFLLINNSHFKNLDKNFVVQIFIYIFAPCVSYMIPWFIRYYWKLMRHTYNKECVTLLIINVQHGLQSLRHSAKNVPVTERE